jgi:hypothetical protein
VKLNVTPLALSGIRDTFPLSSERLGHPKNPTIEVPGLSRLDHSPRNETLILSGSTFRKQDAAVKSNKHWNKWHMPGKKEKQ